ncbi:MAG: hypothetical protein E6J71_09905 [Deltaproteobacteria bacterium]|nr:MAG: hypothetical protein E6J71_09905 [Deltaproteobacteria bacterium]
MSGLGGPERREAGQEAREERRDERQGEREQRRDQARENWQDYADDYHGGEYYGGYYEWGYYDEDGYDEYEYAGTAAAVGVDAAVTLPCTPTAVVIGATTYYQCGSTWYIQAYSGGEVVYTIVNPPAGY